VDKAMEFDGLGQAPDAIMHYQHNPDDVSLMSRYRHKDLIDK
jgi:hypothetical protein